MRTWATNNFARNPFSLCRTHGRNCMTDRHDLFRQLREALADCFSDRARAELLARDSGLKPGKLDLSGAPEAFWQRILAEAELKGKLAVLVELAGKEAPAHTDLADLLAQYRALNAAAGEAGPKACPPQVPPTAASVAATEAPKKAGTRGYKQPASVQQPAGKPVSDMSAIFGPAGPISRLVGPNYRPRPGQITMATAIQDAILGQQHLLLEAGTGIGKTYAYLVPLIWNGRRAIISTANKALQNQLFEKDIPALQRIAPHPFKAALIKGHNNYVCFRRLASLLPFEKDLETSAYDDEWYSPSYPSLAELAKRAEQGLCTRPELRTAEVIERAIQTASGDIDVLRLSPMQRQALSPGPNACFMPPSGCFFQAALRRLEAADIVVTNHAFLARLLVGAWGTLTKPDIVIIDEAHDFERYLFGALRRTLRPLDIVRTVRQFHRSPQDTQSSDRDWEPDLEEGLLSLVEADAQLLAEALSAPSDLDDEPVWPLSASVACAAQQLSASLQKLSAELNAQYALQKPRLEKQQRLYYQSIVQQAQGLADLTAEVGRSHGGSLVRYCTMENDDHGRAYAAVCVEPVEAAEFLADALWQASDSVIATSATLTTRGTFSYLRKTLGVPDTGVQELAIESPFDYARNALLYTPHGIFPAYDEEEPTYVQRLAGEVERLVTASRGRAFVLCTSRRRADQLHAILQPKLPYDLYCQGRAAPAELLEHFMASTNGPVLFGTRSFWEGIDVPGEQLSLVIIDKLPFLYQRDPLIEARENNIRANGGNPFMDLAVPEATLALKQGVGRLIRSETDRGVIAILDSRINKAGYATRILRSLPPASRTYAFEDIVAFFAPR